MEEKFENIAQSVRDALDEASGLKAFFIPLARHLDWA